MKRLTDTQYLILGLIGIVAVAYFLALVNPSGPGAGPLSARSADRDGVLALRLWLEESHYVVRTFTDDVRLNDLRLLFVLNPPVPYTETDIQDVWDWVNHGGHLIVAGNPFRLSDLLSKFGVSLGGFFADNSPTSLTVPLLESPAIQNIFLQGYYEIAAAPDDAVVHVADGTHAVIVSFRQGSGSVWVSGSSYPFTNMGLQEGDNAGLILNMLVGLPQGAAIGFDEALRLDTPPTLLNWLLSSSPGLGIILSMGLTMIYLVMRGRRFGRPIPLPEDRLLREPVEYIQAMANLYRRSGQRSVILSHYRNQLKRHLCERYGLRMNTDDNDLIHIVADRNPDVDEAELSSLFQRLSAKRFSEQELVSTALAVDEWSRRHIG